MFNNHYADHTEQLVCAGDIVVNESSVCQQSSVQNNEPPTKTSWLPLLYLERGSIFFLIYAIVDLSLLLKNTEDNGVEPKPPLPVMTKTS